MDNNIILPHPCDGAYYKYWTLSDWLLKVCEETGEAVTAKKLYQKALRAYYRARDLQSGDVDARLQEAEDARHELCKELTDVITASTSALAFLGADLDERQQLQREINESNARRDGGTRFQGSDAHA